MEYMGKYAYNSIASPEESNVPAMDEFSDDLEMTDSLGAVSPGNTRTNTTATSSTCSTTRSRSCWCPRTAATFTDSRFSADVVYTSGDETVALDEICWKSTGTGCTVNSITQYFQNSMGHFEFYEKYGFELGRFSNCLYWPTTSDVALCIELKNALDDGDSLPSSMSNCPCLSAFGSPVNLYNTYLGGFLDGAESNYTLLVDSVAFVSSYLNYNYADDDKNEPATVHQNDTKEVASNTVFDVYVYAEISVQDKVDVESSNGMGPVALSYCLMLIYILLCIIRF
ncbi:NPC intracellular cholesterol transporter 1 [Phytophthora pseudosyringae]|uniref:NPC intracellular cholesterol transporter 1 n=1 Tax=Phytophthora pseudosyringae TaxID=221518 RepID=A0A8T1VT84_9STRA|nr:NPC intracellular cholesterol transporter 1 [Phytophthora pseudosyringae]